jgi:hypothetical protein
MTAGVLAGDPIYPTSSGFNPAVLDTRIPIAGPPYPACVTAASGFGARTAALPLAVAHFAATGVRAGTFGLDDYYFRIQILPSQLLLGNVVSDEEFTFGVWNAWLSTTQTLETIAVVGGTGLVLAGQAAPPLVFAVNQQRNYTLQIGTVGPPTIAASYTFTFGDAEAVTIAVSGSRITAWALTPDWQTAVKEKLSWKTDIQRGWSGSEMRRALRIAPRRTVSFSTPLIKLEKQFVENQLFAWGALAWALPIWWDGQYLAVPANPGDPTVSCDTVDRDFVAPGLAILLLNAETYEVLQVETLTTSALTLTHPVIGTWPTGSKLYPVRAARLLQTSRITREHGSLATVQPEFTIVEPCDWPSATGLPMYRGAPVLEDSPDVAETAEATYQRDTYMVDNDTGSIDVVDTAQIGFPANAHNWFLQGAPRRAFLRSLLYLLKGAQGEMWVPSYENDFTLLQNIASSDSNITCALSGFGQFASEQNRRDIRIELLAGTIFYRRITGSIVNTPTSELLSLDSTLGVGVTVAQVRRISFMAVSRLSSDEIEIDHYTAIDGLATCSTPFVGVDHDI